MDRAGVRKLPSELWVGWIMVAVWVTMMCPAGAVRAGEPEVVLRDNGGTCREPTNLSREIKLAAPVARVASLRSEDWLVPPMLMRPSEDEGGETAPIGPKRAVRYSLTDGVWAGVSYSRARLFDTADSDEARKRASRFGGFSTGENRDVLDLGMDWGIGGNSSVGVAYQLHSNRPSRSAGSQGGGTSSILPGSEGVDHAVTFGLRRSWGGED